MKLYDSQRLDKLRKEHFGLSKKITEKLFEIRRAEELKEYGQVKYLTERWQNMKKEAIT